MAFGGPNATADALGVPLTTVRSWADRGIPAWRIDAIRAAAQRLNLEVPHV